MQIPRFPCAFSSIPHFVVLFTLASLLSSPAQTWTQWPASNGGNGHYFALTPYATNWEDAQNLAVSWGGHLATITSAEEQDFINRTFLTGQFEHLPLWIGLADRGQPGTFRFKLRRFKARIGYPTTMTNRFGWVTGEPLDYMFWKQGEPNNASPGEYYITINWEYSDNPPRGLKGDWNDTPLNGTTNYGGSTSGPYFGIVERNSDPAHAPLSKLATFALLVLLAALLFWLIALFRSKRRANKS
jgi:Lectin C-type domain